jgi:hypothetical protein
MQLPRASRPPQASKDLRRARSRNGRDHTCARSTGQPASQYADNEGRAGLTGAMHHALETGRRGLKYITQTSGVGTKAVLAQIGLHQGTPLPPPRSSHQSLRDAILWLV